MRKQSLTRVLPEKIRSGHLFLLKLIVLSAGILVCAALDTPAQKRPAHKRTIERTVPETATPKPEKPGPATNGANLPVSVVGQAETGYLSGEASVAVNPKQPTVVRLGLAQNAVSIVEFPAADGIYYVHEGNPKHVSVFQSPTKESDRSITIYPGESFLVGQPGASATITLQMRSGLILILEFVPVANVRLNAHRCVISYDREEVVAARRAAGLAYNLGDGIDTSKTGNTRASSRLIGSPAEDSVESIRKNPGGEDNSEDAVPLKSAQTDVIRGQPGRKAEIDPRKMPKTGLELSRFVNSRLADCLRNPAKELGEWSPDTNGLSLSVSRVTEIDPTQRLVIVAVRNNLPNNLRLAPGAPELQLKTVDGQGNPLNTERVERTYVETTSFEGFILPGSTVYYALVYNAPVMGVGQRMSVLVAHREAADSPAAAILPGAHPAK